MQLSIITVSWNVRDYLNKMIDSILQYTENLEYEIIIVDNNSKDGTREFIKNQYPELLEQKKLIYIDNNFNAGFAKANNQGLKIAKGKYVLFMNPDMELIENSFTKLYNFMEKTPNTGICTCRLLYGDKTLQPNVKANPNFCSQLLVLLKVHHFFKFLPCLKKYLQSDFDYSQNKYVQQVMGAFVFTRKDIMDKINGWDEDYWLWWEDLQICRDVQKLKYDIIYMPITEVIHYEGKSFSQTFGLIKQKRFNRGMLLYFKKNHSKLTYYTLFILQPINYVLTLFTQLFRINPRTQSKINSQ